MTHRRKKSTSAICRNLSLMRGFANSLLLADSNRETRIEKSCYLVGSLGMTLRKVYQEGRKNKVIGRWKASRQKMEVEHVRFFLCDSVTLLLMIIDWTW